jgi:hypothetical protein
MHHWLAARLNKAATIDELWDLAHEAEVPAELLCAATRVAASEFYATASLGLHRPEPFWHERFRVPRGRRLNDRPEHTESTERYVLDERGRVLIVEEFECEANAPATREFLFHAHGRVRAVRFRAGAVDAVRETAFSGNHVESVTAIENGEAWSERYERDDRGRVSLIHEPANREPPDGLGWREPGGSLGVVYDEHGELATIVGPAPNNTVYRAPPCPVDGLLDRAAQRVRDDCASGTAAQHHLAAASPDDVRLRRVLRRPRRLRLCHGCPGKRALRAARAAGRAMSRRW